MASKALASGPSSPPSRDYIGASLPEPELQVEFDAGKAEAPGPPSASPFSSHWERRLAKAKKAESVKANVESGNRAEPLPVRVGLPNEVKEFIVESFACFQGHTTVQAEVHKRFGIRLDGRVLQTYDPRHRHCRLGKRLLGLYNAVRSAYISESAEVAIAHQAHRLRLITSVVEKATNSKDYAAALKGLELAAKEMGGVMEGRSIVKHEGAVVHVHGSVEDARREVAMRLSQIVDGGLLLPAAVDDKPEKSAKDGDIGGGA